MNVTNRIQTITDMLQPCGILADIGCDHAYVCIKALQEQKAERAIACDIHKGPLVRAKKNILDSGYADRIKICLSDGFKSIPALPDACTICGMGGLLVKEILSSSPEKLLSVKQMILGPHSEIPELRKYITEETRFEIEREKVLIEQRKFYVLMDVRAKNGNDKKWSEDDYFTGKRSLQLDLPLYDRYRKHLYLKYKTALDKIDSSGENALTRKAELKHILTLLENKNESL